MRRRRHPATQLAYALLRVPHKAVYPHPLQDRIEEHLREFPDACFTQHDISRVLRLGNGRVSNCGVDEALAKLTDLGIAERVREKPRTFRLKGSKAPVPALFVHPNSTHTGPYVGRPYGPFEKGPFFGLNLFINR
jgi:hypothetical protein